MSKTKRNIPITESVLLMLEASADVPVSGESIAKELGCSRAAIWKAVNVLRSKGYEISAKNRSGYRLLKSPDVLSASRIQAQLEKAGIDIPVICMDSVDSTNNEAKRLQGNGDKRDVCIISSEQTAGRGRQGRTFHSPRGTGLYLSLLLHPTHSVIYTALLTPMAGAATACALEAVSGEKAWIKWVNDIYMHGKKVVGILCEAAIAVEERDIDSCIVGIGVNLFEPEGGFPEDIRDTAGAVFPAGAARENLRNDLAAGIISRFMEYYHRLPEKAYMDDYRSRSFVLGHDIMVLRGRSALATNSGLNYAPAIEKRMAKALDLDEECRLLVEYPDGTREHLSSGEISIRPQDMDL